MPAGVSTGGGVGAGGGARASTFLLQSLHKKTTHSITDNSIDFKKMFVVFNLMVLKIICCHCFLPLQVFYFHLQFVSTLYL